MPETPSSHRRRMIMSGADFDDALKASAAHQKVLESVEKINQNDEAVQKLNKNPMVRFGWFLGDWKRRIAWFMAAVVFLWGFIYTVDRIHEVAPWVPDTIPSPSPDGDHDQQFMTPQPTPSPT